MRAPVPVDAVRLAFGTLTALPTPPPSTVDTSRAGLAMLLAGVPGLVLGAAAAVVGVGARLVGLPELVAAALAVAAVQLGCRGFHLDGLGDTADGLASGYDRERALRIMRTGDSGPAAVATTVLTLLVQAGAAASVLTAGPVRAGAALLAAVLISRVLIVLGCLRAVPTARPQGLGAGVGRSVGAVPALVCVGLVAGAVSGLLAGAGWAWWAGPVAVVLAVAVVAGLLAHLTRRLGGVTGDVLGAGVELSLTAALLVLAAAV